MTYVTLQPHSKTNLSGMHAVIDVATWQDALNRGAAVNPIATAHSFQEAEGIKDRLNREVSREKLQALIDQMKSGDWKLSHQRIGALEVVDELGLLNGHVPWDRHLRGES